MMKKQFKYLITLLLLAGTYCYGVGQEPAPAGSTAIAAESIGQAETPGLSESSLEKDEEGKIIKAEAGDVLVLNLQDALDYAIAYNKTLKNSRLEVEQTDKSLWASIAQGLPQVEGSLDYMTYFNYEMAFSFGGDGGDVDPSIIAGAAATTLSEFPSWDMTQYNASYRFEELIQDALPDNSIVLGDQSTATLQVSQLIFSGQYIVGIQTAKLAKQISEQNLEYSEVNTKESVISSYYLTLITEESLNILKENVNNLTETLDQTKVMLRAGMAEQTDVDQLQITVNQIEDSRRSLERNLELNYNLLRFQLGLDMNIELQLTDSLRALYFNSDPETALIEQFNIEENITFQMMETQEDINEKLMQLEQWNYAPTIAGFYNYNAKIMTTDFDMNPNHLMGASLSLPIFSSGMRQAKVAEARIGYEMAQNNKAILTDQLNLQEKQLKYNLQSSIENLKTQKENVEVAHRLSDSFRWKLLQGMASSLDVTQANNNYLEAETNYLTAVMDVLNAKLNLDKLMNKL